MGSLKSLRCKDFKSVGNYWTIPKLGIALKADWYVIFVVTVVLDWLLNVSKTWFMECRYPIQ